MNVDWGAGILFIVLFPILWLTVIGGLSIAGGWRDLADRYPMPEGFVPHWYSTFSGARMRGGVSYSSCLKLGADARGLCVRPIWCFAPFHPPILIPWSDVEYGEERLMDFLRATGTRRPEELVEALSQDVRDFSRRPKPTDDVTVVMMRRI